MYEVMRKIMGMFGKEIFDPILITGHIKRTVIRANGSIEIWEEKNTIIDSLKFVVNDAFRVSATNFALDALFNGNDNAPTGEDGIAIYLDTTWKEMNCSISEPTTTSTKIIGVFTGTAGTIANITSVWLGQNWMGTVFATAYAKPSSWSSLTLIAADTLTIEWTITVS